MWAHPLHQTGWIVWREGIGNVKKKKVSHLPSATLYCVKPPLFLFREQVSDEVAREKVANGFRSNKKQRVRGFKDFAGGEDDDGQSTIRADAISSSDKRLRLD